MREAYRYVTDVKGPVQEIPHPDGRVTLDPTVRDRWGLPVARLEMRAHPIDTSPPKSHAPAALSGRA